MTTPLVPDMQPGTLLMFPSEVLHCVTPYTGKSPRITLAWNTDSRTNPGDAIPGGLPER
jgi:predicted 2-oxoglutarate/Fe(II)-dependent dioxygenase YbiX